MLHHVNNRNSLLLLLALAVGLAACDSSPLPLAPESASHSAVGSASYRVVKGQDGAGLFVSEVIDRKGGTLTLAGHRLRIAPLTVDQPTRFVMQLTGEDELAVELSATSVNATTHNDVGSRGFAIPVQLVMSYAAANDNPNPTSLTIVFLPASGTPVEMPSLVDPLARVVRAQLGHFSGYAIADRIVDTVDGLLP